MNECICAPGREAQHRNCLAHDALQDAGRELEEAVKATLATLEQNGVPARDADEFIRECVFNAWWDWDYEVPSD